MEDITKKEFKTPEIKKPSIGHPFENVNGQWFLKDKICTRNYIQDKRGLLLDPDGTIESGDMKLVGGKGIGGGTVVVKVGQDIQSAVNRINELGGGTVFLENGTHKRTTDLVLYSYVKLQGQSADNCTLDFNATSAEIKIVGTNAYTTGTISTTNRDATVTGSGTTFTDAMAGRYMLLAGVWYQIASITDTTHLELAIPYGAIAFSGEGTVIATKKDDVKIIDLKISNSTGTGIAVQYINEFFTKNVLIQLCGTGLTVDDSSNLQIDTIDFALNGEATVLTNCHLVGMKDTGSLTTTVGDGVEFNNCTGINISGLFIFNSAVDGIRFVGCSSIVGVGMFVVTSGGDGIEFVSGNTDVVLEGSASNSNAGDGIQMTATTDYCKLIGCIARDNGAYGIDIQNANCDKNTITNCTTNGNSTGDINDTGTGTVAANNVT